MKQSSDRILTTHTGSLPRPAAVAEMLFARERGDAVDATAFDRTIANAVAEAVTRQVTIGIDVVSDGEMSKISYATYIKDRITGFEGDSPRKPPRDLQDFPTLMARLAKSGGTPSYKRPRCTGPIAVKDREPLEIDLRNFAAAIRNSQPIEAFMNAASPGVIALFQPNEYYGSHDEYLEALAEAMRPEYERIVAAGLVLQLDSPDLGLGRHMLFADKPIEEYERLASLHVEMLNHALRNVPVDRVRMHVCWGNYEGPHHHDVPMDRVLPIAIRARIGALVFEASNPRHAHEWTSFRDAELPDHLVLVPGVIDSTTNFVEHPKLVAERICHFTDVVGRERVIAGTDCGFATFAGFGAVDGEVAYAKLASMAEGAAIASDRLWRSAH